jgi:hypothetical protein
MFEDELFLILEDLFNELFMLVSKSLIVVGILFLKAVHGGNVFTKLESSGWTCWLSFLCGTTCFGSLILELHLAGFLLLLLIWSSIGIEPLGRSGFHSAMARLLVVCWLL